MQPRASRRRCQDAPTASALCCVLLCFILGSSAPTTLAAAPTTPTTAPASPPGSAPTPPARPAAPPRDPDERTFLMCQLGDIGGENFGMDDLMCNPVEYARLLAMAVIPIYVAAIVFLCSCPVFCIARCCNGCGGKEATFGFCCPPAEPRKFYSKTEVMGFKAFAVVALAFFVVGPVLIFLSYKDFMKSKDEAFASFDAAMTNVTATARIITSAAKAIQDATKEAAQMVPAPGGSGTSMPAPPLPANFNPDQINQILSRVEDAKKFVEEKKPWLDKALKVLQIGIIGCMAGTLFVILKAFICGPICNKRGMKSWMYPLAALWKVGFLALLLASILTAILFALTDLTKEIDRFEEGGLLEGLCDAIDVTDKPTQVMNGLEAQAVGYICTYVRRDDVCGIYQDRQAACSTPFGVTPPRSPRPSPSAPPSSTAPSSTAPTSAPTTAPTAPPASPPLPPGATILPLPSTGGTYFSCCTVPDVCLNGTARRYSEVQGMQLNLTLHDQAGPMSAAIGSCVSPPLPPYNCSMATCVDGCTDVRGTMGFDFKDFATAFVRMNVIAENVTITSNTLIAPLKDCYLFKNLFFKPLKGVANGIVGAFSKLRIGMFILAAATTVNLVLYIMGMKRWYSASDLEKERKEHDEKERNKNELDLAKKEHGELMDMMRLQQSQMMTNNLLGSAAANPMAGAALGALGVAGVAGAVGGGALLGGKADTDYDGYDSGMYDDYYDDEDDEYWDDADTQVWDEQTGGDSYDIYNDSYGGYEDAYTATGNEPLTGSIGGGSNYY